jgi:hypothetical protein
VGFRLPHLLVLGGLQRPPPVARSLAISGGSGCTRLSAAYERSIARLQTSIQHGRGVETWLIPTTEAPPTH